MRKLLLLACLPLLFTSCIAYSVGTTARPVPKGEFQPGFTVYSIPSGIEDFDEEGDVNESLSYISGDFEGRWGLSDRSDLGLRVPAGSGVIVNYKHLLSGTNDPNRGAFSVIAGGGVVNFGNHAYVEAGLIASGREDDVVPYGGVRAMHVVPLSASAVTDQPTAGVFGGMRFRLGTNFSISPEVGIYHDESALELRKRDIIIVPAISFHWD